MSGSERDAAVVGGGPNGLTAAIVLAQAGRRVTLYEAADRVGGGLRTSELTLPGFRHDVCSAIHPLGFASPFFRGLQLEEQGVRWVQPPAPLAHPLDDGTAVMLERSIDETASGLGADDDAYRRLVGPIVEGWDELEADLLSPPGVPRHPLRLARFGLVAARSAQAVAKRFQGERARALLAGLSGHSVIPLDARPSASFGLVLAALGHRVGWPFPAGGSERLAEGLAAVFRGLGGEIVTGHPIRSLDELPAAEPILLSTTPRQLLELAGDRLPAGYRRRLRRYRYGPAAFKLDWALSEPIPWKASDCRRAATVHVGGTFGEIARSERDAWEGRTAEHPFVLLAQQSLFDRSRAPEGTHTAWAYCHVPGGSSRDMTQQIESQIERFAPGFRDCILARSALGPRQLEERNANNVDGDITGGANTLSQTLARPFPSRQPYRTPLPGVYLCSASTPPGGGVHGMCGYHGARTALASGPRRPPVEE